MNPRLLNQYFRPSYGFLFEGDDGGGGGGATGDDGGGGADGGEGAAKTHTQSDLNSAAAAARKDGAAAAERKLAEDLGVPLDEAKSLIKAAKDRAESEKSDAQKATDAANAAAKAAEEREAAAAKREHDLNVRDALRDAGVVKERVSKVAALVDVEAGADEKAIATAVEATKKEFPELFGGTSGAPDSDTGGSSGGSGGSGAKSKMEAGAERAANEAKARGSDGGGILEHALK